MVAEVRGTLGRVAPEVVWTASEQTASLQLKQVETAGVGLVPSFAVEASGGWGFATEGCLCLRMRLLLLVGL